MIDSEEFEELRLRVEQTISYLKDTLDFMPQHVREYSACGDGNCHYCTYEEVIDHCLYTVETLKEIYLKENK